MPDFAAMLYGGAQKSAQDMGQGVSQSFQQGNQDANAAAGLALQKEHLDQQMQQMQMQQKQLQDAKFEKVMGFVQTGASMPDGPAKTAFMGKFIPGAVTGMGLDKMIPQQALDLLTKDPTLGTFVVNGVRDGSIPTAMLGDPAGIAALAQKAGMNASAEDVSGAVSMYPKEQQEAYKDYLAKQTELKKAGLQVTAASQRQQNQLSHQDSLTAMSELGKFGTTLLNPSSRADLGRMKQMITAADSIKQLTDANLPPNATEQQRIAAYDKLDSRQSAEVIKGLDRLLSQANPTVHGNEALTPPDTPSKFIAKWGESLGNIPEGTSQGAFIDRAMQTVNRERDMNADKFDKQVKALKATAPLAARIYGDQMDAAIKAASESPTIKPSNNQIVVNGKSYDRSKIEKIYADPANVNDPMRSVFGKALGKE